MVKKSTKSKSKRMTLSQKYNKIKKVNAHVRKQKKLQKKKVKEMKQKGIKPKTKLNDFSIPVNWPFKEDFLKEMAWEKKRIEAIEKQKKEARKVKRIKEKFETTEIRENKSESEEGLKQDQSVNNKETPHDRTYFKELRKVIQLSDVVLEVLDARSPMKYRSKDIEEMVTSVPGKRLVLILNKIDLVPEDVVEKWLVYLKSELPVIAFKSSTQNQRSNLGRANKNIMNSHSQVSVGSENLIQLLKNYCRNNKIKTSITVGVIGVPNVGKSSVINSLARAKVSNVGNMPGITKEIKEIHLDKTIRILDTPGVITQRKEGFLQGAMKIDKLQDPIGVVEEVTRLVAKKSLCEIYKIENGFESNNEFIEKVALKMGMIKRGAIADMDACARKIAQDWNNGIIPYYTLPPKRFDTKSLKVVKSWGEEFNINDLDGASEEKDNFEYDMRKLLNKITLDPETEFSVESEELIEIDEEDNKHDNSSINQDINFNFIKEMDKLIIDSNLIKLNKQSEEREGNKKINKIKKKKLKSASSLKKQINLKLEKKSNRRFINSSSDRISKQRYKNKIQNKNPIPQR